MIMNPIACPRCSGTRLFFLETASTRRHVAGADEAGRIHIHGYYVVEDEAAINPRLYCSDCSHEWPIDLGQCEFY